MRADSPADHHEQATDLGPQVAVRWCPSCGHEAAVFGPGPKGRPDASCPSCRALERHRFLSVLLDGLSPWLALATLVVDVAPSSPASQQLRRLSPRAYMSVDFDPAADGRAVDVRASITDLPLARASVDLLVAYHVLEHVPDDESAMREIRRVLKPSGIAVVQVPWSSEAATDEDPTASTAERVRRFGQADHVRMYGRDFEDRLRAAGLDVVRLTPGAWLGEEGSALVHCPPGEAAWVLGVGAGDGGPGPLTGGVGVRGPLSLAARSRSDVVELRERLTLGEARAARVGSELDGARLRVARLETEVRACRREADRWRRRYERLGSRFPVRLAVQLGRLVRRPWRRLRRP